MTASKLTPSCFDALAVPGDPLILVNVWDAVSSEGGGNAASGVQAIATTSTVQ